MKKVVILKAGSTYPEIAAKYGDFDAMIIRQMEIDLAKALVVPVDKKCRFPNFNQIAGLIITGSHAMVTDQEDWSIALASWLKEASAHSFPILGICYGHQLLAKAFGGIVDYHPGGEELGTAEIQLTSSGGTDPLLSALPSVFWGHVAHSQTVIQLPAGAVVLAKNNFEPHHAFVLHQKIWGVQFHPEFTAGVTLGYITAEKDKLMAKGHRIETLRRSVLEHVYGKILLTRFKQILV